MGTASPAWPSQRAPQPQGKLQEPRWGQRGPRHLPLGSCQQMEHLGTEGPCRALPCAPFLAVQSQRALGKQQPPPAQTPARPSPGNCSLMHLVSADACGQSGPRGGAARDVQPFPGG